MNLQQIRNKYKSILEEDLGTNKDQNNQSFDDEEQSERQWINIARKQKQKRILTQSAVNKQNYPSFSKVHTKASSSVKKSSVKLSTEQTIIDLKQKLAQSLLNCSRKDAQLGQFQHLVIKKNEQIKLHQKTIAQLKKTIEEKDSLIFEEKIHQQKLFKQISERDNTIEELKIQNQLLRKHVDNYAKQLQSSNLRFRQEKKRFEKVQKEKQKVDSLKSKIDKLKDDVKRLQFLLSDYQGYAPVMMALQGKHFLGKPAKQAKQLQYWYPDALINGLQKFLKRQQIGYGNKVFTENLVKFIYCLLQRSEKTGEKNIKSKYNSRIKQMERKKNQIMNVFETEPITDTRRLSSTKCRLNASSLRKTTPLNGSSQLKSRDFSICLQKSLCVQRQRPGFSTTKNATNRDSKIDKRKPFIIESLQRSVKLNQNHKKHIVMQLIESFCKGVEKLFKLENKTLSQQKIAALCSWLRQSVEEIFETNKQVNEDECNLTGKWKTLGNL